MKDYIPCVICGKKAKWSYIAGDNDYCENCVPKGCSCQDHADSPCVEYHEICDSMHDNSGFVIDGWEEYYRHNPEVKCKDKWEILEEQFIPPVRKKTRRTRLLNEMTDEKFDKRGRTDKYVSKPKGFKKRKSNDSF